MTKVIRKPIIYKDTPAKEPFKFSMKEYQSYANINNVFSKLFVKLETVENEFKELVVTRQLPLLVKEVFYPEEVVKTESDEEASAEVPIKRVRNQRELPSSWRTERESIDIQKDRPGESVETGVPDSTDKELTNIPQIESKDKEDADQEAIALKEKRTETTETTNQSDKSPTEKQLSFKSGLLDSLFNSIEKPMTKKEENLVNRSMFLKPKQVKNVKISFGAEVRTANKINSRKTKEQTEDTEQAIVVQMETVPPVDKKDSLQPASEELLLLRRDSGDEPTRQSTCEFTDQTTPVSLPQPSVTEVRVSLPSPIHQQTKPTPPPLVSQEEQITPKKDSKLNPRNKSQDVRDYKTVNVQFHRLSVKVAPKNPQTNQNQQLKPSKVCFLLHGLEGSSMDLRCMRSMLGYHLTDYQFFLSESNEGSTTESIEVQGKRFAMEVIDTLRSRSFPNGLKISFVGHSLGGLIVRAALPHLREYRDCFKTYVSLSSPHLGSVSSKFFVSAGMKMLGSFKGNESIREMSLTDDKKYLLQLSGAEGLNWFQNIVFIANFEDGYVSADSARVAVDSSVGAKDVTRQMANNIYERLEKATVVKLGVFTPNIAKGMDVFLGRQAHVEILENPLLKRLILAQVSEYF